MGQPENRGAGWRYDLSISIYPSIHLLITATQDAWEWGGEG